MPYLYFHPFALRYHIQKCSKNKVPKPRQHSIHIFTWFVKPKNLSFFVYIKYYDRRYKTKLITEINKMEIFFFFCFGLLFRQISRCLRVISYYNKQKPYNTLKSLLNFIQHKLHLNLWILKYVIKFRTFP